jgi:hypothetical protein
MSIEAIRSFFAMAGTDLKIVNKTNIYYNTFQDICLPAKIGRKDVEKEEEVNEKNEKKVVVCPSGSGYGDGYGSGNGFWTN